MVRRARMWFAGAKYHVTSRGNRKSSLFYDDEDYEKYLDLLEETRLYYPFILHSFCLMTNHIHLQLETLESPLSTIMKNLNTKYAKFFNKKYKYSGHVFEKRFGAELLNSPEYELDVSKYIHMNPVSAGMVSRPEDYPWSSYRAYLNLNDVPLIDPQPLLAYFPHPQPQHYKQYMKSRWNDKFFWENGKLYMGEKVML
ncbi:transposase [Neobacillus pocheonensis]|uniref:transposase n=1 Tax=Neobacillus pocheonensis TaxID=363869 RepID=UPI003D29EBA0